MIHPTRRDLLCHAGLGLGGLALASLLREGAAKAEPHHDAKAKSIILLFQSGGPSQMDLFDHKPELQKRDGQWPQVHRIAALALGVE